MEEPKVYNIREFAKVLKISESKARLMVRNGEVRSVRFGDRILIPAKVVDELLAGAC